MGSFTRSRTVHAISVVAFLTAIAAGHAQEHPRWEVGSIKRNTSNSGVANWSTRGEKLLAMNVSALTLLQDAFPYESYRMLNVPGWASSERYDVTAVASGPVDQGQQRRMMQMLLADHFHLVTHTEIRQLDTYSLVLARADGQLGPQIERWDADCEALRKAGQLPESPPFTTFEALAVLRPCQTAQGAGLYSAGGQPLATLARVLGGELGALVMDRTGLKGNFNILLRWNRDPSRTDLDAKFPSLMTALQEQLGLKLESRREPVEVLVIDRLERPATE